MAPAAPPMLCGIVPVNNCNASYCDVLRRHIAKNNIECIVFNNELSTSNDLKAFIAKCDKIVAAVGPQRPDDDPTTNNVIADAVKTHVTENRGINHKYVSCGFENATRFDNAGKELQDRPVFPFPEEKEAIIDFILERVPVVRKRARTEEPTQDATTTAAEALAATIAEHRRLLEENAAEHAKQHALILEYSNTLVKHMEEIRQLTDELRAQRLAHATRQKKP